MLDYAYQDDEVTEMYEEANDYFSEVPIDAYSVVDIGVQQKLFDRLGILQNGLLSFYIKNLLDEDYMNTEGYPATDRMLGISFSVRM